MVVKDLVMKKKEKVNQDIVFSAYCRKLLRELKEIKMLIESNRRIQALALIDEIIANTTSDIED